MVCGGKNASFFVAEAELEPAAGGAAGAAPLAWGGGVVHFVRAAGRRGGRPVALIGRVAGVLLSSSS